MKVFHKTKTWESKVNFVDDNNVVLGFDIGQSCCEHADWFIADVPTEKIVERETDDPYLTGYNFDPKYIKETSFKQFDSGGMVIFRIVKGRKEKFIHILTAIMVIISMVLNLKRHRKLLKRGQFK